MVHTEQPHNIHVLELRSLQDARAALASLGLSFGQVEAEGQRLQFRTVALERVAPAVLAAIQAVAAGLGETLTLHERAGRVLLSGRLDALRLLAARLAVQSPAAGLASELQACLQEEGRLIRWGRRSLDFRKRIYVMSILNCTPDSFYPGSRLRGTDAALEAARTMIASGADILDVGGESTRPGSDPVSVEEELARVIPVLAGIRKESDLLLSIDTRKVEVAREALQAGADMVNDVSALRANRPLAELAARSGVPIVLMHMRGEPKTMQVHPRYENTVAEIAAELRASVDLAFEAGIEAGKIILDPGIGFGKRVKDNLLIVKHLRSFRSLGFPVLIGLSRKSFLGELTGEPVEGRLTATVAANALAMLNGADIVRVHDVREAAETARVVEAVREAEAG
jgi:dihydropteroate synthase